MAIWYAKSAGDVAAANAWNSLANGTGTDATLTAGSVGSAADTCNLNGLAMTSTTGLEWTQALITATTGTLTPTGALTINGAVAYYGTSTSGMIVCGAGTNLTLTYDGDGVFNNAAGYAIVFTSTATYTLTCNLKALGGRAIWDDSSATTKIWTGNISTSLSFGLRMNSGTLAWTPGPGVSVACGTSGAFIMYITGGTLNILGMPTTTNTSYNGDPIVIYGGTANLFGVYTHAQSADCQMRLASGTLNLVKQSAPYTPLVLSNSGTVVIYKTGGTLNITGNGGAVVASIACQNSTSYAAILGGTDAQKGIISYPGGSRNNPSSFSGGIG